MMSAQPKSTYRWNPYGVFQKTTVANQNPSAAVRHQLTHAQEEVQPAQEQHHFPPANGPQSQSQSQRFDELPYYQFPEHQQQHQQQWPHQRQQLRYEQCPSLVPQPNVVTKKQPRQPLARRDSFSSGSSHSSSHDAASGTNCGMTSLGSSSTTNSVTDEVRPSSNQQQQYQNPDANQQNQTEHSKMVSQWINYARSLSCDERIDAVIYDLESQVQLHMLDTILLSGNSKIFVDLCTLERGNVVTQLLRQVETHSATPTMYQDAAMMWMEANWQHLTTSQFGAIALTRLFQVLPATLPYQQRLARLTLQTATTLALHQFGNFMVSEVLKTASQNPTQFNFVFEQLAQEWAQPYVFAQLAESRFGSHVLETFLKLAPAAHLHQLCQPLLTSQEGLGVCARMGWHKQANYPLQAAFRALCKSVGGEPLVNLAKKEVLPRCEGSPYCRNLCKAMTPVPSASTFPGAHPNAKKGNRKNNKHTAAPFPMAQQHGY